MLVAFLAPCLTLVADAVIAMFDRGLADAEARAGKDVEDWQNAMAQATHEKGPLLRARARTVLAPAMADPPLRCTLSPRMPPTVLRQAADDSDRLVRPLAESSVDCFETRYGSLPQCTPPLPGHLHVPVHPRACSPPGGRDAAPPAQHHAPPDCAPGRANGLGPAHVAALRGGRRRP